MTDIVEASQNSFDGLILVNSEQDTVINKVKYCVTCKVIRNCVPAFSIYIYLVNYLTEFCSNIYQY